MLLEIDLGTDSPLYLQIAAAIRQAVAAERLVPGDHLPAGRALAGSLGVNLDTVQRAYRLLADEGLVVSRVGRGTQIARPVDRDRVALDGLVDELVNRAAAIGVSRAELASMVQTATSAGRPPAPLSPPRPS